MQIILFYKKNTDEDFSSSKFPLFLKNHNIITFFIPAWKIVKPKLNIFTRSLNNDIYPTSIFPSSSTSTFKGTFMKSQYMAILMILNYINSHQIFTGEFLTLAFTYGGGVAVRPLPVFFCPLIKKSSGNPYLKIHDFSQLFITDAPMKKKNQKNWYYPRAEHFWDTQYKYILNFFALIK